MLQGLIGNTPLIRFRKMEEAYQLKAELYGKIEGVNLTGSIKDRPAYKILTATPLKKEAIIVEPSSGNMGISLAAIGGYLGFRVIITMPENMSKERVKLMELYGAEVVLTRSSEGMSGAINKAKELAKEYPLAFLPNQFENNLNVLSHFETTGPEIFSALPDVDLFVSGIGTGGTITGVGTYLKQKNKTIKVIGVEPHSSAYLTQKRIGKHKIQGIGAGFLPKILSLNTLDDILLCHDEEAKKYAKELLKHEKIWAGISSGAACFAAISLARSPENEGKKIVFILPDHGSRYLSTDLFN